MPTGSDEQIVMHRVTTLVHSLLLREPLRRMSGEGWEKFHSKPCSPVCIGKKKSHAKFIILTDYYKS
jgi:hypothetical protein